MAHTFSRLLYHIVFSTRNRRPDLRSDLRRELLSYLHGVLANQGAHLFKGGAVEDHVHLLVVARPTHAPAELARTVKANTSRWLRESRPELSEFAWQSGYSVFSVSESNTQPVLAYIESQEEHHRRMPFATELRAMLERNGIAFDPQRFLD